MIFIAHRGLTQGPNSEIENSPDLILESISQGFECEIDLWIINQKIYLGHDQAQYQISSDWLDKSGLWIHAKNLEALSYLYTTKYNYFWHENDQYVVTSHGYIWAHPASSLTENCIMVMPEYVDSTLNNIRRQVYKGICSDYIKDIKHDISRLR